MDIDLGFERVYERLGDVLDLQHLAIWLLDEPAQGLRPQLGLEGRTALGPTRGSVHSAVSMAARCARRRQEVLPNSPAGPPDSNPTPGTVQTGSAHFDPLIVRDRLVGVLSIQSQQAGSYGQTGRKATWRPC